MTKLAVVADASAIIALDDIGILDQLAPLFTTFKIPQAVADEIAPTVKRPDWVTVLQASRPIDPRLQRASLGPGETEAMSLALELGQHQVVLDDLPARQRAVEIGLAVIGTLGLLVLGKRNGLLESVRPSIGALQATDFHMSQPLIDAVLRQAGEQ